MRIRKHKKAQSAVTVAGQLGAVNPYLSVLGEQQRTKPPRYAGRSILRTPQLPPPPFQDGNVPGVLVPANAYWQAVGRVPSSPILTHKTDRKELAHHPAIVSDVQAALEAKHAAPTQHISDSGVWGLDRQANGALTAVTSPTELRWGANPVPALETLNRVGKSTETGRVLAADMNGPLGHKRSRSPWLYGVRM